MNALSIYLKSGHYICGILTFRTCSKHTIFVWFWPGLRHAGMQSSAGFNVKQVRIGQLLFVSVLKWVLVLNYCKENEFDSLKNMQVISVWMVVHQDSLWNWGMQQLGKWAIGSRKLANCSPWCMQDLSFSSLFNSMCFFAGCTFFIFTHAAFN